MSDKIVFRSKIGLGLVLPVFILLTGLMVFFAYQKLWGGLVVPAAATLLIAYTFFNTKYIIIGTELTAWSGFFRYKVDILKINKITPIKSMLSAPAASTDRLEVFYGMYDSIQVSPADKAGFVAALQVINPKIREVAKEED